MRQRNKVAIKLGIISTPLSVPAICSSDSILLLLQTMNLLLPDKHPIARMQGMKKSVF
jgi:hypothetical protein